MRIAAERILTWMDRGPIVDSLREVLRGRGRGLVAVHLFGSRARGEAHVASDVDVGVVLAGGTPRHVDEHPLDLAADLERHLGIPVDLVVLNGVPPELVHRVLRDGIVVYEGDHEARVEFEVRARNEYFDLRPMLERYRRALIRSA